MHIGCPVRIVRALQWRGDSMRPGIHPELVDATITCACGSEFETKSTKGSYRIDICSACHPFFTGKAKLIDTAGRVERFNRKYGRRTAQPTT